MPIQMQLLWKLFHYQAVKMKQSSVSTFILNFDNTTGPCFPSIPYTDINHAFFYRITYFTSQSIMNRAFFRSSRSVSLLEAEMMYLRKRTFNNEYKIRVQNAMQDILQE